MKTTEHNIDGLIGPTHFFGGLGAGNVASEKSAGNVSHPRAAVLQGLEKMKLLHDLGIPQMVMPPQPRPALYVLRDKGYAGDARAMLASVIAKEPELLPIIYSSSAMWTANAATISASADTADGKLHITPANLISNAHRRIEAPFTANLLKRLFPGDHFVHHSPLANTADMKDEGAANHMHITPMGSAKSLDIFAYGEGGATSPSKYAARQHLDASKYIAAQHNLSNGRVLFLQQHPDAIDAGVFHNDVIATSNDQAIFYHEMAFADERALIQKASEVGGIDLFRVASTTLSLHDAVCTYLFNSQIVSIAGGMAIIAPRQCQQSAAAKAVIDGWIQDADCPIAQAIYVDVDQSMANGGGPACLRLRLWLTDEEACAIHPGVVFTDALYAALRALIEAEYPAQLSTSHLQNPDFPATVLPIYPKLAKIFALPDLYEGWLQ